MIKIEESNLTQETISKLWKSNKRSWFTDCNVDFSNVINCDSSTIAFIVKWAKNCQEHNQKLVCINVPKQLLELIQIYKIGSLIEIK